MLRFIFTSVFISVFLSVGAQQLKGRIFDEKKEVLPFANVFIEELKTGTISDSEGFYKLELEKGKEYTLTFRHLGHKSFTTKVKLTTDEQVMDVTLPLQVVQISEVKVLASGEDPAYYIMRRAIALAPYYAKQIEEYKCKVYLKGTGVIDKVPALVRKRMEKEGIEEHKPFVMESVSKVHFQMPDKIDQVVLAQRSTGEDSGTDPMQFITSNIYETNSYGMISPFDTKAFSVYRFQLEGVFEDQGRTINKIKIIPRRKGKDLFSGYINIADDYWNVHSASLSLKQPMTKVNMQQIYAPISDNVWMPVKLGFKIKFAGMGFKVRYNYIASISEYFVKKNPALDHDFLNQVKQQQQADAKLVGVEMPQAKAVVTSKTNKRQKKINELLAKEELSNREMRQLQKAMRKEAKRNTPPPPLKIEESVRISKGAIKDDSIYWTNLRPIKLTDEEKESFSEKDSIVQRKKDPEYVDSLRNEERKFKLAHLLFGKNYRYYNDSAKYTHRLKIPGVMNWNTFAFNTVDGVRVTLPFRYSLSDTVGRRLFIAPEFAYALERKKFDAQASVAYYYNGLKNAAFQLKGGSFTTDFAQSRNVTFANDGYYSVQIGGGAVNGDSKQTEMSPFLNSIHTLFLKENYKKTYQKDYVDLAHTIELANGLQFTTNAFWEKRTQLFNTKLYSFIDYAEREFTQNQPINSSTLLQDDLTDAVAQDHLNWEQSHKSGFGVQLSYQPRNRYYLKKYEKQNVGSKYPRLSLYYEKALKNVLESDVGYDFLQFTITDDFYTSHNDVLSYRVSAAKFFNTNNMQYPDFAQFVSHYAPVALSVPRHYFRLLPYYEYATNNYFVQANLAWTTDRLLLKRLPKLNETLMEEALFVNFLKTDVQEPYWEVGYGLRNVFFLLNIELVRSYRGGNFWNNGIRVSLNF